MLHLSQLHLQVTIVDNKMKTFKFYVHVFPLVSFIFAGDVNAQNRLGAKMRDYNSCLAENNVSNDDMYIVDDIIREVYKQSQNEEKIRKNGCVLHCLMQKEGVMDGLEFNVDEMHSQFTRRTNSQPGDTPHAALDNCMNEAKDITRQCEKSFAFVTCFLIAEDRFVKIQENIKQNKHDVHNVSE